MGKVEFKAIGFDRRKFKVLMDDAGMDTVVLTSPESIAYVTGYPVLPASGNPILFGIRNVYPFYVLINSTGKIFLVAWEYSILDIELDVDAILIHSDRFEAEKKLRQLVRDEACNSGKIGIEFSCPYWMTQLLSEEISSINFSSVDDIIENLRYIKSESEIEMMRKSTAIVEASVKELFPLLYSGIGRSDVINKSKKLMIENGASGIGHCTISFGASNPEVEINEKLEDNKLVVIDLGASYYGYASDNRRYGFTGEIPEHIKEMYQTMCGIVNEIGDALAPGVEGKELYFMAVELFKREGLEPKFRHIGHTMGLQTEEVWFDQYCERKLEAGVVLNVELYNMIPSGENIGNEETYLVTADGNIRLTNLPQEIIRIKSGK